MSFLPNIIQVPRVNKDFLRQCTDLGAQQKVKLTTFSMAALAKGSQNIF
jgi:hypothetical protein